MQRDFTCLLIDDDLDDQEQFVLAMESLSHNIRCVMASDGEQGIRWLKEHRETLPDIIFLDLNMPRMTGKECLRAIRQLPHLSSVPVIIFSTSSEQRDMQETQQMGAAGYLVKYTSMNALVTALKKVIEEQGVLRIPE
ncbi:response regulator [Chitinophaga vietnamensis]|uniref:response regulator n=1 Tax=Chitinophaga vietnamensis TaxID=2593957 RepID=UPI001177D11C|nr:response regulator [Chitinophaga vietnamensis]